MINYKLIDSSIVYYETKGFKRVETPWAVSEYIDNITKPKQTQPFVIEHNGKHLVASGEQSFLYQYLKGFLPPGEFQTVTPCFRYEPFSELHTKYFIKNELIKTDQVDHKSLLEVVEKALQFFNLYFPTAKIIQVVPVGNSYDIEVEGQELGSYGIRKSDFLTWIYGTGCAEPRMSTLMRKYGISQNKN